MHQSQYGKLKAAEIPPEQSIVAGVQAAAAAQLKVSLRASPDDDVLLTSAQARARIGGVSTMCIWRWIRDPAVQFPLPVKVGTSSRNYWRLGDLRRWQAERVAP